MELARESRGNSPGVFGLTLAGLSIDVDAHTAVIEGAVDDALRNPGVEVEVSLTDALSPDRGGWVGRGNGMWNLVAVDIAGQSRGVPVETSDTFAGGGIDCVSGA